MFARGGRRAPVEPHAIAQVDSIQERASVEIIVWRSIAIPRHACHVECFEAADPDVIGALTPSTFVTLYLVPVAYRALSRSA
jgi:hypothetical protein